jgi:hypothetical protein
MHEESNKKEDKKTLIIFVLNFSDSFGFCGARF